MRGNSAAMLVPYHDYLFVYFSKRVTFYNNHVKYDSGVVQRKTEDLGKLCRNHTRPLIKIVGASKTKQGICVGLVIKSHHTIQWNHMWNQAMTIIQALMEPD